MGEVSWGFLVVLSIGRKQEPWCPRSPSISIFVRLLLCDLGEERLESFKRYKQDGSMAHNSVFDRNSVAPSS